MRLFEKPLLAFCMLLALASGAEAQKRITVSPDGKKTIQDALSEASRTDGDVDIILEEGTYRLDQPLSITSSMGKRGRHLAIRAMEGKKAVVTSSIVLGLDWKPYRNGILVASTGGDPEMDMLIADGEARHMARFPDYDSHATRFFGTSADATSKSRVASWKNPKGGYLHAMHRHDWGDFHYRITGSRDSVLIMEGGHQNNRKLGLHESNRMVENIFEELDAPMEWYYDRESHMLYYYPKEGEDVARTVFESPQLKGLIMIKGTLSSPVCNVTIEGITLEGAMRTFMEDYEPLLRSDWCIYRGGAVMMENTIDCHLKDCEMRNLGGNGVFLSGYNRKSSVEDCHLHEIGASAICFVGRSSAVRSACFEYGDTIPFDQMDMAAGPRSEEYPAFCQARGNLIHDIGRTEKQVTGIEISMSSDITVSHNTVYSTPRSGINISEGTWGGHVIEHNDVFDTVRETGDHGSFNSWGRDRWWHPARKRMDEIAAAHPELVLKDAQKTTVIRFNRFRCDRGWDIDLDDGSSNYEIYGNLCLNGGLKLREGFGRKVYNNILVNNTFHPHVWFLNSNDEFYHNIVMLPYKPIRIPDWGKNVDRNIFTSEEALRTARKEYGTDSCSVCCPVRFVSPASGDFTVEAECKEVFDMGFRNISMDSFGVESPKLKEIARKPAFPVPAVVSATGSAAVFQWHGLNVKTMDSEDERSATGMDEARGVLIISVASFSSKLRDCLQPNDVILSVGPRETRTYEDLAKYSKDLASGPVHIGIYRDQRMQDITVDARLLDDGQQ